MCGYGKCIIFYDETVMEGDIVIMPIFVGSVFDPQHL